jgi:hypothetical protein
MKVYLNAGFGDQLGAPTLAWIRDHGFSGVRQEGKQATRHADAWRRSPMPTWMP